MSATASRVRVAAEVRVTGVCQGVGFRPFVHRLARDHRLDGWVRNEAGSVRILAEGDPTNLEAFLADLPSRAPPLARIDTVESASRPVTGRRGFRILASREAPDGRLPVSPDVALCAACERDLWNPTDRRFRYPFVTCTDCGPRFTVIEAMPYDRERSTMRAFPQCPACLAEYEDPSSRRYHSETNSCPDCGPRAWFERRTGETTTRARTAIAEAAEALRRGEIVAIRGLGGFHLAVDARSEAAVARLRRRKSREAKPLAIMVRTMEEAATLGFVGEAEAGLLASPERPIVLLPSRSCARIASNVAPGLGSIGVVLAYTPLHELLLEAVDRPLVMTSGNRSDEPIAIGNQEALDRLGSVADGFLLHDREIAARYDDSLVRVAAGRRVFLRRARGYAPLPIRLPVPTARPLLAVGAHLKNTFTLASGRDAYVSQHIGDLENLETVEHFRSSLERFRSLFRIDPELVVCDAHPGYLSTSLAESFGAGDPMRVQHHHAHVAAVAGEHGVASRVLGLAFDGTGYGADGHTWGAEFLEADLVDYRRRAHLRYVPLPGGDLAVRTPWRTALGYASLEPDSESAFREAFRGVPRTEIEIARRQIDRRLNAPLASSMGRLFDAAAAVLGVRRRSQFEGQAPMELEALAGARPATPLPFPYEEDSTGTLVLDPLPLLRTLGRARVLGACVEELAAQFHESVAAGAAAVAVRLAEECELDTVVLSGGCLQNARLAASLEDRLRARGLRVLLPEQLGPNDGAISYGQAVVAAARLAT